MTTGTLTSGARAELWVARSASSVLAGRRYGNSLARSDGTLRDAEALGQHDLRRADDVAAPALDAVLQAERRERGEVAKW